MSSADEELIWEINELLDQHYPDERISNLYDAAKALLEILKDPDEDEDDGDEDDEVFEGYVYGEHAQPMSELDREIELCERELQKDEEENEARARLPFFQE